MTCVSLCFVPQLGPQPLLAWLTSRLSPTRGDTIIMVRPNAVDAATPAGLDTPQAARMFEAGRNEAAASG